MVVLSITSTLRTAIQNTTMSLQNQFILVTFIINYATATSTPFVSIKIKT